MRLFFRASFVILMTPSFGQSAALPAIADDDAPNVAIAAPAIAAVQRNFLSISTSRFNFAFHEEN
jgi:hypothetical protein